jgi:hypothetical protein
MHKDLYDFAFKGVGSLYGFVIGFEGGLNKAYSWGVVQAWLCTFSTVNLTHLLTVVLLPLLEALLLSLGQFLFFQLFRQYIHLWDPSCVLHEVFSFFSLFFGCVLVLGGTS